MRAIYFAPCVVVFAGLVAGCGDSGSSGGGGGGMPQTPTSYVATTDAFVAWADEMGSFAKVPVGTYASKRQSIRGTIDRITGVDDGVLASLEIYKGSDGHIYAVDLASTSTPGPQQVSNESSATIDDACSLTGTGVVGANSDYLGVLYVPDSVTPTNSRYFYRLPGPDGVCNTADDVIRMVSTSTPSNAAPATVPAMPITGVASQLGGIMGFVAKSGASLLLYDANFANPVLLGTFPAAIGVATPLPSGLVQGSPTGQLYVIDGSIYFVNYASPSISGPLFALPTWTPTVPNTIFAASPTTLYFAVNTPASGSTPASASIYSMPGDGSAAPSLLVSLATPSVVAEMQFPRQSTNLMYGAIISGGYSIYALEQGGTTPVQLFAPTQNGGTFTATATSVYYTTWNATNNTTNMTITRTQTQSGIVGVNGSTILAPVANSLFASGGEYVPYPLTVGAAVTVQTPLVTVFQVQGLSPVTVSSATTGYTYTVDGASGGTLSSIDTASNLKLATLGTVPAGTATFLSVNMRDTNHTGFVDASNFASTQNPMTHDTYLINSYNSSTLERVTANL